MRLIKVMVTVAALGSVSAAAAQTVFKSTMPDGKVAYGEKPVDGAVKVDRIEAPTAQAGISALTPEERARAEQMSRQRAAASKSGGQSEKALEDARRQLKLAEAARDSGKDALPNERSGIVGGGSRLNEAYAARQKALEDAVNAARKRVSDLQSGR